MLATVNFGTVNTGASVYFTLLNEDKSQYQARTNSGVTELRVGSGAFGVSLDDVLVAGKTIVWDIDGTGKTAPETFLLAIGQVQQTDWVSVNQATTDVDGAVLGAVLDNHGMPLVGVEIVAYLASDALHTGNRYFIETDGDGEYDLRVPSGASYTVIFRYPDKVSVERTVTV
jgi:hypothetical protein